MEALATVIVKVGKYVCGFLLKNVMIFAKFQSNIQELDKRTGCLEKQKNIIDEELKSASKEGKQPTVQVKEWLEDVKRINLRVHSLKGVAASENAVRCSRLNCRARFRLSKKAMKLQEEIKEATDQGKSLTESTMTRYVVEQVEEIPAQQITGQETATKMLEDIVALLQKKGPGVIGIWGMGGVGKTTLMRNLNNMFASSSLTNPLGVVIWVTVSKNLKVKEVQSQIAGRLKLAMNESDSIQARAISLLARLKKEENFLLLLDDVWERLDLHEVGIPHEELHKGSKIIFTTRSFDVCREMNANEKIRMEVLNEDEAWSLFRQKAGPVVDLDGIEDLARDVARECSGLPLAIVTVGRAMREKTRIELWKNTLRALQRSVSSIRGIEKELFLHLKLSYDSLEGKNIKPCFLYCSLFPENFSIRENDLIQYWMAEGLLDEQKTMEECSNKSIALIESLKDSCMLEDGENEGTVRMHDIVRRLAIWIATSLEDGSKSFVQPRRGLTQIAEEDMWEPSTKRVSLIENNITSFPDRLTGCSMLSTLLLQGNPLKEIPEESFIGFQALRILNLSGTFIRSLPLSLIEMKELRALFLVQCLLLAKLPPLGELKKLEVLDVRGTQITELTREMMGGLTKLKQLNLSYSTYLESIQSCTISQLSSLEVLEMTSCAYSWDTKRNVGEGQAMLEELQSLLHLSALSIKIKTIDCLALDLYWFTRLRRYRMCIGRESFDGDERPEEPYERKMTFGGVDLSGKKIEKLLGNTSFLVMNRCWGINGLTDMVAMKNMDVFISLKSLFITSCDGITHLIEGDAVGSILPNLKHLRLKWLSNLERIFKGVAPKGGTLRRLRTIEIYDCKNLRFLVPYALLPQLENLEKIEVTYCPSMTSIILDVDTDGSEINEVKVFDVNVLPKLQILKLVHLPDLSSICEEKLAWPSLMRIYVESCASLATHNLPTSSLQETKVTVTK